MAHAPMTKSTLNTADPTIVPNSTSLFTTSSPMKDVTSSGADPPAAIRVAPATSLPMLNASVMTSSAGTKSQTMASPASMYLFAKRAGGCDGWATGSGGGEGTLLGWGVERERERER